MFYDFAFVIHSNVSPGALLHARGHGDQSLKLVLKGLRDLSPVVVVFGNKLLRVVMREVGVPFQHESNEFTI
jgi:hypothetical protein